MWSNAPSSYTLEHLVWLANRADTQMSPDGKYWYPARPMGYYGFRDRFRIAWQVFTGRADAVRWPGGQ